MRRFEHAAAARGRAEAIVVRAQWADGRVGWGETLPREYVTGETLDTVADDLRETIWPALQQGRAVPTVDAAGRCINAASCAMDLAACDALWDKGGSGRTRASQSRIASRVSGVLGSADPHSNARKLRLMRRYGLRDFKLKLGFGPDEDAENLNVAARQLGNRIARGRYTLRVDVNGAWTADQTPGRVAGLKQYGVCVVEQPVYCSAGELADLARRCELPLMADESLLTEADAEVLLSAGPKVWWNVRISKNGGLTRAMSLCGLAADKGIPFVLGCMVGESGILSAAQRRLLQMIPPPRFVEGNYGRFLLADDLTKKSLRFGYGGRLKALKGAGLGVAVDEDKIAQYGELVATVGG